MTPTSCAAENSARLIAVLLLGVVQAAGPGPLLAQTSGACDGPRFREFDYWRGTWAVESVEGKRIGTNTISAVSEGCALLEEWESKDGPAGMSVNYYDPSRERWEQRWVGGGGLILRLAGQLQEDAMEGLTRWFGEARS